MLARRDASPSMVQELADRVLIHARIGGGGRVCAPQQMVRHHRVLRQPVPAYVPIRCPGKEPKLGVLHVRERCRVTMAVSGMSAVTVHIGGTATSRGHCGIDEIDPKPSCRCRMTASSVG